MGTRVAIPGAPTQRVMKSAHQLNIIIIIYIININRSANFTTFCGRRCQVKTQSFPAGSDGKEFTCSAGDLGSIPGSGRFLEKGMAAHARILAWRIS